MFALEILFWASVALIVHTHLVYPVAMRAIAAARPRPVREAEGYEPSVSLIVACYDEEAVIARKVENLLALDYPPGKLEIIVASDGSTDATVEVARRAAGGDERVLVIDLPRAGKVRTQDRAVELAGGEVFAFSDANAFWEPDALRRLVAPFADEEVGYVCGEVVFENTAGDNQEGLYWRYEMALRRAESEACSVTAGNGAIYATRATTYLHVDERMGHDLSLPFNIVKHGYRAVFASRAKAREKMVPDVSGEFRRKRRMMSHAWPIVVHGGLADPRGYDPLYLFEIVSHRLLRYTTPFLHLAALILNVALVAAEAGDIYVVTLAVQAAFIAAGVAGTAVPARPLKIVTYYWLVTLALALGLWDWIRTGTPATWEKAEGTR